MFIKYKEINVVFNFFETGFTMRSQCGARMNSACSTEIARWRCEIVLY